MNYWADVCLLVSWLYLAYYGRWAASRLKYERNTKRALEATIRTLENQVSRMADELSKYERTTPKLEERITDMANDLSRYETGISEIEKAAGLPLCGHCGMQGGKHHVACPTGLGNVTPPLSGSESGPQA